MAEGGSLVLIHGEDIFLGQGEEEGRREESVGPNDLPVIPMTGFCSYIDDMVVEGPYPPTLPSSTLIKVLANLP